MKTYRVAILGCRARGIQGGQAYHAHPRTEIVGLCDLVQERLDEMGEMFDVDARFTDLDEMIEQTQPDVVAIPTGTEFHHELALRVLEHGVNIDIEKPLCTSLDQADEVVAKAKEKDVEIAVHHQGRVGAGVVAAHKAYTEGRIGKLLYLYTRDKGYYGGLGIMNIATHKVNTMLKFAGHVRSVSAVATTDGRLIQPEDVVTSPLGMGTIAGEYITATLQFDNDVTGGLLQHRLPRNDTKLSAIELFGTEGRMIVRWEAAWALPHPHYIPGEGKDVWEPIDPIVPEGFNPDDDASLDEYCYVDEYVRALDEGRPHECNGAEGLHVLEVLMGVFESAAYGKRVALPQERRSHPLLQWRKENGLGEPDPVRRDFREWYVDEDRRLGRA
ncbi:MAG: hypothetical protein CME26_15050 [Gemmatimonadetes bacterium]|nr:hypothetical protein [Gemmatimonadota bacterium]